MSRSLKKVALGAAIVLASWSVVAAQQTSSSQETKPSEAEEAVFAPPPLDQLKTSRADAEAATDLSDSDKKNVLSFLDQAIRFLEETERLNAETQKFSEKLTNGPARIEEIKIELSRKVPAPDQIIDLADAARMTSAELDQREREEKSSLAAVRESLNNLQDQIEALKARPLLLDRRDLLAKLENTYRRYYQKLQSMEFTEQRISSLIDEYADFLDGHLLWMRSSRIIGPTDLGYLPAALFWVASPNNWWLLFKDLITSFGRKRIDLQDRLVSRTIFPSAVSEKA